MEEIGFVRKLRGVTSNAEKALKKDAEGNLSKRVLAKLNHDETFSVQSTAVAEVRNSDLGV
jgi:hypothetical protein